VYAHGPGVTVGAGVEVGVSVGGTPVGVTVGVSVGVAVEVIVGVAVGVSVSVTVEVIVGVAVGVSVGVAVEVIVGVIGDWNRNIQTSLTTGLWATKSAPVPFRAQVGVSPLLPNRAAKTRIVTHRTKPLCFVKVLITFIWLAPYPTYSGRVAAPP